MSRGTDKIFCAPVIRRGAPCGPSDHAPRAKRFKTRGLRCRIDPASDHAPDHAPGPGTGRIGSGEVSARRTRIGGHRGGPLLGLGQGVEAGPTYPNAIRPGRGGHGRRGGRPAASGARGDGRRHGRRSGTGEQRRRQPRAALPAGASGQGRAGGRRAASCPAGSVAQQLTAPCRFPVDAARWPCSADGPAIMIHR